MKKVSIHIKEITIFLTKLQLETILTGLDAIQDRRSLNKDEKELEDLIESELKVFKE